MCRHKICKIILLILFCTIALSKESYANINRNKIYNNIYIENISVSGLTKEEAIEKLKSKINSKREVNFLYDEDIYPLNFNYIDLNYNIKETVDKAYNIGKINNLINNTKTKLSLKTGNKINFKLEYNYSNEKLDKYINYVSNKINREPIDASVTIIENNIEVLNETNGIEVNKYKFKDVIKDKIEDLDFEESSIPIQIIAPEYNHEDLSNINTVLGTYETKFNKNNYDRSNNIYIATSKTNNIILDSNEEFSFNKITGERNEEQGFRCAPIIINGELTNGIGGGVCQVSSTIYNAALYSGLEIVQAINHSIPSSYIEKGRDATVSYGSLDLKFKNIYDYPILIKNTIIEDKIVSTIYGNDTCKKEIDIETELIETIPNKIVVKKSNTIYSGQKQIKEKGRNGYKVKTYRIYKKENGEISNKELIRESYYPPIDKIIIKGSRNI